MLLFRYAHRCVCARAALAWALFSLRMAQRSACKTFGQGLAQVNALNATQLAGCNNVTLSLAAGNYTGAGNVGVVVAPVLPANVTLRIGLFAPEIFALRALLALC